MLNIPEEYDRDTSQAKLTDISRQITPASLLDISDKTWERWWMNQEWLELRLARTTDQNMVAVKGSPCAIPSKTVTSNQ
jgi:hypothetical protein